MKNYCTSLIFFFAASFCLAQPGTASAQLSGYEWDIPEPLTSSHLRGLSVVSDSVVWVSGTNGIWMRSEDGGRSWAGATIEGADSVDFRDIHAFDANTALVLSAGEPGLIYRTVNGGKSWKLVFADSVEGVFYDGMDFSNDGVGVAYGDPIEGYFRMAITENHGKKWKLLKPDSIPPAVKGEGGFAASGTGIVKQGGQIWFATGNGEATRIFKSYTNGKRWRVQETGLKSGPGWGIYSMHVYNEQEAVVVGGNYMHMDSTESTAAVTMNEGNKWIKVTQSPPSGYRSCVCANEDGTMTIATGRNGMDLSLDKGKTWKRISDNAFYSCAFGEKKIFFSGKSGKIGVLKPN